MSDNPANPPHTSTEPASAPTDPPHGSTDPAYGFVGLGQMGAPMAGHLAGPGLIVHDARTEAMTPLVEKGAEPAADLTDVARAALISIMVRDDAQVNEVATALLPAATPGTVLAIHSTIRADTAIRLAGAAEPYGIEVVDAPVSGGPMGAAAGTLAVMVGASSEATFARVKEAFDPWAGLVLHMGGVGAGTYAKLARNLLHFVSFAAAAEAQRLAEAAGVPLGRLGRIVRHSDALTGGPGAIMIRRSTAPLPDGDPLRDLMEHVLALGDKDLSLALDLAAGLGVDTPLARLSHERLAAGLGLVQEDPS